MVLTEPQAGSSLSDLITTASPLPDGRYSIRGQKIFISGGDHELAQNIVHLVLARIVGAPAASRGYRSSRYRNSTSMKTGKSASATMWRSPD